MQHQNQQSLNTKLDPIHTSSQMGKHIREKLLQLANICSLGRREMAVRKERTGFKNPGIFWSHIRFIRHRIHQDDGQSLSPRFQDADAVNLLSIILVRKCSLTVNISRSPGGKVLTKKKKKIIAVY